MKKLISFFTVIFMLMSLAACAQKEEPTTVPEEQTSAKTTVGTPTDSSDPATEPAKPVIQESVQTTVTETQTEKPKEATTAAVNKQKPKISATDLFDANTIPMLLNRYSCVKVVRAYEFGKQTEQYLRLDDEIMEIVKTDPNDGEPYYYGQYGAFYFEVESDRTKAYVMLDDLNSTVQFPHENTLANLFSGCKVTFVKEKEDTYVLKVTYPDRDIDDYEITVTVKKDTLAVVKAVYKSEGKITETAKITLGAEPQDDAKIISKWKAKKKTVTIIAEKQQGNNKTLKQTELKLPSDWEINVNDSQELTAYLDSDYTVPYRYPGNGKSYKLYLTNAMG